MVGKALDVRRVRLKQSGDHGVARFADIEPDDFGRSPTEHAHADEVLVSSGQNESAGPREIPEKSIRSACAREVSNVFRIGKQFGERLQQPLRKIFIEQQSNGH